MRFFSTDIPETASELFDGELVVANYGSGIYYSVSETGSFIWQGLRNGLSDAQVAEWLSSRYPGQADGIPAIVSRFIDEMLGEGLIAAVPQPIKGDDLPELKAETFGDPVLERYDDMQELLLLDPVHDVAEAGWPKRAGE